MQDLTVVFDLDGTLVDTAPDLVGATNHALADLGLPPVEAAHLRPWVSFGARSMIEAGLKSAGHAAPPEELDRLRSLFLAYYEVNIARESQPYPGMRDAAARLRAAGARLAVCTNKREDLTRALLGALDLGHLFTALAGRDTYPVHKPHPDHLLRVIADAGGHPGRAIMVGDSDMDIAMAKAAGVPVVAVSFGYTHEPVARFEPDRIIDHYDHLVGAVGELHAERLKISH